MLDRKDFVPMGTICAACGSDLKEGVIDRIGSTEKAYGADCAKKKFGPFKGVPDMTIRASRSTTKGGGRGSVGRSRGVVDDVSALRYVLLRADLLSRIGAKGLAFQPIINALQSYRNAGSLTAADVKAVTLTENNAKPDFKMKNLLDVHTAYHLLEQKKAKDPHNKTYLEGVQASLLSNLTMNANLAKSLGLTLPKGAFR